MSMPQFKVNVTHGGVSTNYTSQPFTQLQVKRRENNYDVATLWFADEFSQYYGDSFSKFDEVKIYLKDASEGAYTQVFGGTTRQVIPLLNQQGLISQLICKGYGYALEETHCKSDYGSESSHPTIDAPQEILVDLVTSYINKSLGSANNTGYAITGTKIANVAGGASIKYINNPYRTNLEVIDLICELTSAIGAGATAGAHWIVDNNKNLIINTIAAHENTTEWPDWWNTDAAGSTLEQGIDFQEYTVLDKAEEFANNVLLITDFRRPPFDFWTNGVGCAALWGNDNLNALTADNANKIVGDYCIKMDTKAGYVVGYGYYPSAQNAGWNTSKWGSIKTIPRLNFYSYLDALGPGSQYLRLFTTNHTTNYFQIEFSTWNDPLDQWVFHSIPIGPYWATQDESKKYQWTASGSALWTNINGIAFKLQEATTGHYLYIDDLHFSGKIARSAKNSYSILGNGAAPVVAAKDEHQRVLISRNAMDDSCVAADDTGFAGRIAYAELLRRQKKPLTITFSIAGLPDMKAAMAGQKLHVHACKKLNGTFRVDTDMRIVEIQHDLAVPSGYIHTVTATSDLLNTTPISIPDQYAMWQENMFLNSKEAKNIRAGAEVDLLIPIMEKDYPSDDD